MRRYVPLSAFEHDVQAVIASDADGTIRFCNRAASRLLDIGPSSAWPRRCWELGAFRAIDGSAFCAPQCPVQRAAREGRFGVLHHVVAGRGAAAGRPFELISFLIPTGEHERCAVLHFLRPCEAGAAAHAPTHALDGTLEAHGLSAREREVLQLIAEGRSTRSTAAALGITPTTVRNHLGHIFLKLGVHRRLEAVVALARNVALAEVAGEAPPEDA